MRTSKGRIRARQSLPLPQRQIRCPRPCTQTLRSTAHDNCDRRPRARLQDIRARRLAHAADPEREEDVAVERHLEVGRERQQVRLDPGERFGEARGCWKGGLRVSICALLEANRDWRTFCGKCC
jgi:hypothetical protein